MKVSSIRRNKAACRLVRAQQSAALALDIPISQVGPWILHRKIEVRIISLIQLRTHDMYHLTSMTPSCEEEWSQLLPKGNNQWLVSTSRYQGSNKLLQLLKTYLIESQPRLTRMSVCTSRKNMHQKKKIVHVKFSPG